MIIENDDDFRDLLNDIFELSEQFALRGSFSSIEEFCNLLLQQGLPENWIPQLLVADVLASVNPRIESASFLAALRDEGLNFAALFISSADFGSMLRVLRKKHPHGWGFVLKNSRLTERAILEAAFETYRDFAVTR